MRARGSLLLIHMYSTRWHTFCPLAYLISTARGQSRSHPVEWHCFLPQSRGLHQFSDIIGSQVIGSVVSVAYNGVWVLTCVRSGNSVTRSMVTLFSVLPSCTVGLRAEYSLLSKNTSQQLSVSEICHFISNTWCICSLWFAIQIYLVPTLKVVCGRTPLQNSCLYRLWAIENCDTIELLCLTQYLFMDELLKYKQRLQSSEVFARRAPTIGYA